MCSSITIAYLQILLLQHPGHTCQAETVDGGVDMDYHCNSAMVLHAKKQFTLVMHKY